MANRRPFRDAGAGDGLAPGCVKPVYADETTSESNAIRFEASTSRPRAASHRSAIFSFATTAKEPFAGVEKVFSDEFGGSSTQTLGRVTAAVWPALSRQAACLGQRLGMTPERGLPTERP